MALLHYRELVLWQKAMDFVVAVYQLSVRFPRSEQYGLTNQLRRAAVSVPSNIAEGQGRGAGAAFVQFLRVANGSIQEAETQILLAVRLGFVTEDQVTQCLELSSEVRRILAGLKISSGIRSSLFTNN